MPTVLIALSSLAIGWFVGTSQDTSLGCAAGLFTFLISLQLDSIIKKLKQYMIQKLGRLRSGFFLCSFKREELLFFNDFVPATEFA